MIVIPDYVRIDISAEIKRLAPVLGKDNALKLEQAYLLGDEDAKKRVLEMIDTLKAAVFSDSRLRDSVLMEPPPAQIARAGDINAGTVLYGKKKMYPFMLPSEMFLTHLGIFGSSGYGKTNVVHHLIGELGKKNIPILIFDFSKRNYRDLLSVPGIGERMQIFTVGRNIAPFRFNPLAPPEGVEISQWAKEFAEIFDHAYWLLGGGKHIILKALDAIYRDSKPFSTAGRKAESEATGFKCPQIRGLKYYIDELESEKNSARERNWIVTAQRPLASLCFRDTGHIFDCDVGTQPSSFFEGQEEHPKITVLELDALSTNDKTFFIEIMLQWIRDWLIVKNAREKLSGVIIIEEAHHILNREKAKRQGSESVIDLIFREVRELGMGMVYVDQHPSLISYPALGNTTTHIYMNLGLDTQHSSDIQDACSMLGLNYDTEGRYLRELPVGHAFILCRKLEFPHPFLIEFPLVKLSKGSVSEEELRKNAATRSGAEENPDIREPETEGVNARKSEDSKAFKEDSGTPKSEEKTQKLEGSGREHEKTPKSVFPMQENTSKKPLAGATESLDISEAGWKIMRVLGRFEASATSEIYKNISMSGATFKQNAERLVSLGLLGSKEAKVFRQNAVFYFLTNRGAAAFGAKFSMPQSNANAKDLPVRAEMFFRGQGWTVDKKAVPWLLLRGEKRVRVVFASSLERAQVSGELAHEGTYFVAGSENAKNALIQMAAKRSCEDGKPLTLAVATLEELEKGEKFKKIMFT